MHQLKSPKESGVLRITFTKRKQTKEKRNKPADLKKGNKITIFPNMKHAKTDQKGIQKRAALTGTVTLWLHTLCDQAVTLHEALERNSEQQR